MRKQIDAQPIYRPIFWIVSVSTVFTAFYIIIFSHLQEPIQFGRAWGVGVIGSVVFNGGCLYLEKEGQRLAAYLAGVSGLIANTIFAASAFSFLLGHQSSLYHFLNDPR